MKVLHVGWGFIPWRVGGLIEYTEDLMCAQTSLGYEVAYFYAGRHYPLLRRPRMKRWSRRGILMYELLNCPVSHASELGTRDPERELSEPISERAFQDVLDNWQPDLVHIQELAGLPSSLIEVAKSAGLPIVMTLQDYFLLCPTLKLLDYDQKVCLMDNIGTKCVQCCADAPAGQNNLVSATLRYEVVTHVNGVILRMAHPWLLAVKKFAARVLRLTASAKSARPAAANCPSGRSEDAYQRRRHLNVARLNRVDMLIGQSRRLTEIYRMMGVHPERIKTLQLTLEHLSQIQPALLTNGSGPVTFGTLNGCASMAKGSQVVLGALRKLYEWGLSGKFRLMIMGSLDARLRKEFLSFSNIVYRGPYERDGLDRLLEGIHAGIVPSIWEEAYGYVGVEFLAKGIPVIGNQIGGITDYVLPGLTGWLNADTSADGLANVMASLIQSPEQILAMNRNIVANRGRIIKRMDEHAREIDGIYKTLLSSRYKLPLAQELVEGARCGDDL
jgi:glycosyltransferase involved in cell wall biosynthesis